MMIEMNNIVRVEVLLNNAGLKIKRVEEDSGTRRL